MSGYSNQTFSKQAEAKQELDLTHMPQYIKQAPWYMEQKD
jgi:hypothetical protein